jgi:hypothetical protein
MSYRVILKLQHSREVTEHISQIVHPSRELAIAHRNELVQNFRRICVGSEIRCETPPKERAKPQGQKRKRLRRRRQ